jgi:polar amino acid transport system substrate-binding protein
MRTAVFFTILARVILSLVGIVSVSVWAETAKIAAGEYAPFVSQKLPQNGVTAAIVTAALKSQNVDAKYDFLPWKRGYIDTSRGDFLGTFPYLKTEEREATFFYSESIFTDRFRMFVNKKDAKNSDWKGATICVPIGYDTTQIEGFTSSNKMYVERPPEISDCFKMLAIDRVKLIWASELVGMDIAKNLLGSKANVVALDLGLLSESKYYFIVSKSLPNAAEWISRFDAGLKIIQKNGTYQKILTQFSVQ